MLNGGPSGLVVLFFFGLIFVGIPLVVGVVGYAVASSRGGSGRDGFAIAAVLAFLIIIVIVAVS